VNSPIFDVASCGWASKKIVLSLQSRPVWNLRGCIHSYQLNWAESFGPYHYRV